MHINTAANKRCHVTFTTIKKIKVKLLSIVISHMINNLQGAAFAHLGFGRTRTVESTYNEQ